MQCDLQVKSLFDACLFILFLFSDKNFYPGRFYHGMWSGLKKELVQNKVS